MLETPASVLSMAALLLAVGIAIAVVLYAISLTMRASQPVETPETMLETLKEAVTTLGRTSDILAHAVRGIVADLSTPDSKTQKLITTPLAVVIEKLIAILKTPPKERTSETYAFLEHYVTSNLLRALFDTSDITADTVDTFARERHTPPETRRHLMTALLETRTSEDTDNFQSPFAGGNPPSNPPPSQTRYGRHAANDAQQNYGRTVATGRVVVRSAESEKLRP